MTFLPGDSGVQKETVQISVKFKSKAQFASILQFDEIVSPVIIMLHESVASLFTFMSNFDTLDF